MTMTVEQIMNTRVVTVEMDDRLKLAKEIFDNTPFNHLLVIENDELKGVLSQRDLFKAISPKLGLGAATTRDTDTLHKRIHQVMSHDPITISPSQNIHEATQLILEHNIGSLPVVNNNKIVGILTWKDLLKSYISENNLSSADK